MSIIKGTKEYKKFKNGDKLTRKQAMANCYLCNGLEDSNVDCKGKSCPIYPYRPYKSKLRAETTSFMDGKNNVEVGAI